MKMLQKVTFTLLVAVLVFGIAGSPFAQAASKNETNGLTEEQMEFSRTILGHLEAYIDENGNQQLRITEAEELESALNGSEIISYDEFQSVVEQFNTYISEGDNVVSNTADSIAKELNTNEPGQMGTMAISCGDALSIIGLIHAGSYSAAAYALGITGPAALLIPLLTSAAYTAASIACD